VTVGRLLGTISLGLTNLPTGKEIEGHTDSEKLIYALSRGWTIKQVMDTVTGAAAMTWWDASKKTFNIYKNKERSLFFTHNDLRTVYAYASEEWILKVALNRAKLSDMVKNVKEVQANDHMEIVLGDNKIEEVKYNVVTPLVVKTPTTTNYGPTVVYPTGKKNVKLLNHDKPTWMNLQEVKRKDEPFRSTAGWLDMSGITEEEFEEHAKYGCSMCQCDIDFEDHQEGFVKWIERDTPLCKTCANEFNVAA